MSEKTRYVLDGILPILQTPFAEDGSLDVVPLRRLADHVIQTGAAGVIYPAVASEVSKLSMEERRLGVEVVLSQIGGRVPVFVGASASRLEESARSAPITSARGRGVSIRSARRWRSASPTGRSRP